MIKKIKLFIGSIKEEIISIVNIFFPFFNAFLLRYSIWLIYREYYEEYFGRDWDLTYIFDNPNYLIRKIPLIFIVVGFNYFIQNKLISFYIQCKNYRNNYYQEHIGEIEWESLNCNNKTKDYELNNGDIMAMLICDNYIYNGKRDTVSSREDLYNILLSKNNLNCTDNEFTIYIFVNTNTKFIIKNLKTIKILKTKMINYIKNNYFMDKSYQRIKKYKEELIKETWHPKRFMEWCYPNIIEDDLIF